MALIDTLGEIPDPRRGNAQRHELLDILAIALVASVCGAERCVDFAEFAEDRETLLREFLSLKNGLPSHDGVVAWRGGSLDRPLPPLVSGDPDAFGHAEGGEAVDAAHGDGGFDLLAIEDARAEARAASGGPVHLAVDATGLKVYGEGEWKVRMHGPDKRRVWRKLHLAVDTRTGALHAHALTASEVHDGAELEGLLARSDAPIAAV